MSKHTLRSVCAVACFVAAVAPARAAGPLGPLSVGILTTYRAPDGTMVTDASEGILMVPALIDADHDPATGPAGRDLAVHVAIGAGSVTVRTVRLLPVNAPLAQPPDPMPARVEITLTDPRPASTYRVALAIDALASSLPAVTEATFGITGSGRGQAFSLDLSTQAPGDALGVTAELFSEGPNGERSDPKLGRVDFAPVPATTHVGIATNPVNADEGLLIDFRASEPTRTVLLLQDREGASENRLDATIDRLPASLAFSLSRDATGAQSATYQASDRVDALDVSFRQQTGQAVELDALLHITSMATAAAYTQDADGHATFDADSPIGRIEAGFAQGGAARLLSEPNAYLSLDDRGGVDSVALRLFGLEHFEAATGDPTVLDATMTAGPLHVIRFAGTTTQQAWVRDLPHTASIHYSSGDGTLTYDGSSPIGELSFDATDPSGISGRATTLHVLARGIPASLDLTFSQEGGTTSLDAKGAVLGLIEVQLTSGPDERLDPAYDGVLLRDLSDRYVAFARITGLRKVTLNQGPPPDLKLDTTGGRVLKIDLNRLVGSKVEYVRATLDHLVPNVSIRFVEDAGQEILYSASAATNSIVLDTNSGDRWNLHASMAGPLPSLVDFCAAPDGACTGYARPAGAGSYSFDAAEHTTVSVFDCARPLDASCPSNPSRYTSVNLRLRHLEADADFSGTGFDGDLYMNTTSGARYTMNGSITSITSSDGGFSASFGGGFWADHRLTTWSWWGLSKNKSGSVNCPGGTGLSVRVLGFWFGVTSFLC